MRHVIFKIPNLKSELSGRREKRFEWERWSVKTTATSLPPPPEIHLPICGLAMPFNSIYGSAQQTPLKKKKGLEFLKPVSFNFKKVNGPGQGNYASEAPRLWSPKTLNKTFFFQFSFWSKEFICNSFYQKKGFWWIWCALLGFGIGLVGFG